MLLLQKIVAITCVLFSVGQFGYAQNQVNGSDWIRLGHEDLQKMQNMLLTWQKNNIITDQSTGIKLKQDKIRVNEEKNEIIYRVSLYDPADTTNSLETLIFHIPILAIDSLVNNYENECINFFTKGGAIRVYNEADTSEAAKPEKAELFFNLLRVRNLCARLEVLIKHYQNSLSRSGEDYDTVYVHVKKSFDQAHGKEILYIDGRKTYLYGYEDIYNQIDFSSKDTFFIQIAESDDPLKPGDDHITVDKYQYMHTLIRIFDFCPADVMQITIDTLVQENSPCGFLKIKLKEKKGICHYQQLVAESQMEGVPGTPGMNTSLVSLVEGDTTAATDETYLPYDNTAVHNSRLFADWLKYLIREVKDSQ